MKLYKISSQFTHDLFHNHQFLERLNKSVRINYNYDIPYLSGYSQDGKTIYIDRHLRKYMLYHGKKIDIVDFLTVHEVVEKALIDLFKLHYQRAHHLATHFESLALKKHNVNWWVYTKFLKPQIKTVYSERLTKVPSDLDITPYKDEHEKNLLREIMAGARINKKEDNTEVHTIDPKDFVKDETYKEEMFEKFVDGVSEVETIASGD